MTSIFFLGFIGLGLFLVVLVFVVVQLIKSTRRGPSWSSATDRGGPVPRRDLLPGVATRAASDGFWLESAALAAGTIVSYRYFVAGQARSGSIEYQPGREGHFVYTGHPPDQVEVLNVWNVRERPPLLSRPRPGYNDDGTAWVADTMSSNLPDSPPPLFPSGPSAY